MSGAAQIPMLARVGSWWRGALRFGNGVLGADKYEHYVQYHRASGCGTPLMTEREFWRDYQDWQEAHPEGRCC
ncbi:MULTISPECIES: YbdD/YjiX family protein [Kocuria]|uniref:Uncharacterized short protein YbdD, DUF466 family n=1 Tax=Kocuria marina subsp. indica TaxID=1049583 RepID=A0A1X7E1Q3_9MICC|nr:MULTISPECIES: YbdD/YjiX family protein [Kocuria]OXS80872.1 hypothetical protein B1B07_11320 [Kocuria indica]RLP56854.1 YbdD/YjiX family protein [Kocuria indica]SMF25853.1 Uncharacterized short protein YbdD, DUF466 family [Kocuria indica]